MSSIFSKFLKVQKYIKNERHVPNLTPPPAGRGKRRRSNPCIQIHPLKKATREKKSFWQCTSRGLFLSPCKNNLEINNLANSNKVFCLQKNTFKVLDSEARLGEAIAPKGIQRKGKVQRGLRKQSSRLFIVYIPNRWRMKAVAWGSTAAGCGAYWTRSNWPAGPLSYLGPGCPEDPPSPLHNWDSGQFFKNIHTNPMTTAVLYDGAWKSLEKVARGL